MSSTTSAEFSAGDLQTPTLDKELSNLLHSITEHGGYAYSSMTTLAASGDLRAAEAAREMAWEQLHSGPWHSVLPIWRDAYSMACLHVAKIQYRNGDVKEALRVLDLGLIMGGTVLREDLEMAVEVVNGKARVLRGQRENGHQRVVSEGLDEAEVLRVLPPKSLSLKIVAKRSALSLEAFLRENFLMGSPVVIMDCMSHWPARAKWNDMDYLKRTAGDRTVPVEF